MTLKDIAQEAGVSISTVSRVINQKNAHAATPELQQKIWDIARRTGYTPSQAARALKSGTSSEPPLRMIACLFARDTIGISDNSYFTGIAQSFEKEALRYNYSVQCLLTAFDLLHNRAEAFFNSSSVDGIVIIGRHDLQTIRLLRQKSRHIVYAGLNPTVDDKYDSVTCDARKIGYCATKYLIDRKHTHIAYIGDTKNEVRFLGYCDALKEAGIDYENDFVFHSTLSMESGYNAAQKLLSLGQRPSAVFCMNDHIALGAMRAFEDAGLKIPRDISVIGVDDIEAAQYSLPKLTTIYTPMEELGSVAAKVLIDRITKGHTTTLNVSLPFHIVERSSCAVFSAD